MDLLDGCLKIELEIPIADEVLDRGQGQKCGTLWKRRKTLGCRARSSWS